MNITHSPATLCPLSGAYLIEASAGTGKTWTLTGILLRLLIEKNTRPERIVATTFTRAAAQEMQERLYARLTDFYEVCAWAKLHQPSFYDGVGKLLPAFESLLNEHKTALPALGDSINQALLYSILNQTAPELDKMLIKIKLLLSTVDKIFIGTLDSLAQKWLKEFAHELGNTAQTELITELNSTIYALVHDELRALHVAVAQSSPKLYHLLDKTLLADVPAMCQMIDNALQFYTAKIDTVELMSDAVLTGWQSELDGLLAEGFGEFADFFDEAFRLSQGMSRSKAVLALTDNFGQLPIIAEILTTHGIGGFKELDKPSTALLEALTEDKLNNCFKKNAAGLSVWQGLPLAKLLKLKDLYDQYQTLDERFISGAVAFIAEKVRVNLIKTLNDNHQTSFSANMLTLVQGLSGVKGELIARHIRHLYPVALIDEAQDVSGEQMALIERIYLSDTAKKTLFENGDKGFLLLVGDPKQAIYRFRGGDVANYAYMKSLGPNTDFQLLTNRRSNRVVIEGLNAWFGTTLQEDLQEEMADKLSLAHMGEGICYQQVEAVNDTLRLSWQAENNDNNQSVTGNTAITLLHLPEKKSSSLTALNAIALHINTLLQGGFSILDKDTPRPILPSDIAILLPTNDDTVEMQEILATLNIGGVVDGGQSVFKGQACEHLYTLLDAVLHPKDETFGSLLVQLFKFTLTESETLLKDEQSRAKLLVYLKEIQRLWLVDGLLKALNYAFLNPPFLNDSLWVHLASFQDSERYLADMWQLFELVSAWQLPMGQFLYALQKKQATDTSTARVALPLQSGVAVMTMHKSKGLEFPIVYIYGLDKSAVKVGKKLPKLYPYTENYVRKLSPTRGRGEVADFFEQLDTAENLNEKKRLGYVALTRAAEQIFVVGQDKTRTTPSPMQAWGWLADGKTYAVPAHLADKASLISLETLYQNGQLVATPYVAHAENYAKKSYPDWHTIYPKTAFTPERSTSFTGLARLFGTRFGMHNHDYDEAETETTQPTDDTADIRARFMRGAVAGTFLHRVLELAGEGVADGEAVANALQTASSELHFSLDEPSLTQLQAWLMSVLHSPFLASGTALADIAPFDRINELEFTLSLSHQTNLDELGEIFATHAGIDLPPVMLDNETIFGYLTGKIDLVYCYQNQYYVVDYKSNFLGDDIQAYNESIMHEAMDTHSYWLQAALYQLALHRLLSVKLPDYQGNEVQYLGASEYVFLRGVTVDDERLGRLVWQVPFGLVLALDRFFG